MTTTPRKSPEYIRVRKLVDQARSGWLTTEKAIMEIIACDGWNVLGYRDFSDLFDKEFADVHLAGAARSYVVYEMFNAGRTADEVASSVKGITATTAQDLKRQKDSGVSPDHWRRGHTVKPREQHWLPEVELDADAVKELRRWKRSAKRLGMSWDEFVLTAIRAYENLDG